jgi:LysR family transcriptional regulator, hypochlorite-specific transcription factor HypT
MGSVTQAAERRNVTQPAFTRRIKTIEDWLGVEVIDRTHRPARVRPAIAQQIDVIRGLAVDLHRLKHDVQDWDGARRRLVIAAQHSVTVAFLPAFIGRMQTLHPSVAFRLRSANRDECYGLLMTRQANLLLSYETDRLPIAADETLLEKLTIGTDWLVPVASPAIASSIATLKAGRASRDLRIITYPRDVFFGNLLHHELLPALAQRHRIVSVCETALVPGVLQLALAGVAVAWLPRMVAERAIAAGTLHDLSVRLGNLSLDIVAARLRTPRSRLADNVWSQFELLAGGRSKLLQPARRKALLGPTHDDR